MHDIAPPQPKIRPLDGVRLLVVEDDTDSREMLCMLLERFGATCETAPDAATARAKLTGAWLPDVVISDISLPDEDGYSLSRWVRERPSPLPPPPFIAFTAMSDRAATEAAGFVAHVMKPIDIPRLLEAIQAVLASKRISQPP